MHLALAILVSVGLLAADRGFAAVRLKELAYVEGVRENQLVGYGLVVGLAGTGDKRQTVFSAQTLANLLERMGVSVSPAAMLVRNTAAVMVSANLPAFARPGMRVDVTAAAIGDATNLQGGLLLLTPLKGADGLTYAVAQGSVVTGGFVAGRGGNSQVLNHPTAGRVPNGALVEKDAPSLVPGPKWKLQLRRPDFTTAARMAEALNRQFPSQGQPVARADSASEITIQTPPAYADRPVELVAAMESIQVEADAPARIVINERTGTIVVGKHLRIAPVSILHGGLTVEVQTSFAVSQPAPLAAGATAVVPQVGVGVREEKARNVALPQGATVEDLVRALLAIGSTPRDVIAILQNLKAAGALEAELEII